MVSAALQLATEFGVFIPTTTRRNWSKSCTAPFLPVLYKSHATYLRNVKTLQTLPQALA